ncbi:MAG: hypothetical protein IPP13_22480 [Kouleothrix sp.]|nr:hypothetical protein [Kouleothrix sp.]
MTTVLIPAKELVTAFAEVSNGAEPAIAEGYPYRVEITIEGVADLLFHRWNNEAVEEKAKAAKGSTAKKTDDIESYVYRAPNGNIALPGEYLRQATIHAAKFRQDPRSPRKSAMDLFKAAIVNLTPVADLGSASWDYLDRRRVVVQRAAVTRTRPAMLAGWRATFELLCNLPEYIPPQMLNEVISNAGRLVGVGDFRPTYGRFVVAHFGVLD